MTNIETIGNCSFATHGAVIAILLFSFFLCSNSHSRNGVFCWNNGVYGTCKSELDRATNLSGIFSCRHYGSKSANVVVFAAHHVPSCCCLAFCISCFNCFIFMGSINQCVENCFLFNENIISLRAVL